MSDEEIPRDALIEDGEISLPTYRELDAVPKDELRELVEQWRQGNLVVDDADPHVVLEACADELEELLNDE